MPSFLRAGVYVTEQLSGPTPPPLTTSPSAAAFIGEHWRGPSYAVQCNSWSDFTKYFGGFQTNAAPTLANTYLPYSVYEFFANGGATCWVQRLQASLTPGSNAAVTLKDQQTTAVNTLTLTAGILGTIGNIGTWGNSIYVTITTNTAVVGGGYFNLSVYYGGSTAQYLVEKWTQLSMNPTDPRYVLSILNSPSQGSNWVVATNLFDVASSPFNAPAYGTFQLSGGTDAGDPSSADFITALTYGQTTPAAMDVVPGIINLNLPGTTTSTVLNAAITYAQTRPYTFLVMDPPSGQTPAGVVSFLGTLSPVSSYAALYYPWVTTVNPAQSNLQSSINLPPGGFVLGQMAKTDQTNGVWQAPAGTSTTLVNVVAAERPFAPSDLDTLNSNNVNALKTRPNGSVVIWGTRTMQQGYGSLYVPIRRTLNYIEASLSQLLEFSVFQPNDALLWGSITAVCNQFLAGLWGQNAFPGSTVAQAYYVTCNATNNTAQSIATGVVNTTVGVALLYPAEFINLVIAQFQSSGVTTIQSVS